MPVPAKDNRQLDFPYPCTYKSLDGLQSHSFTHVQRFTDSTFIAVADESAAGSAGQFESSKPASQVEYLFIKFCKK